MEVLLFFIVAGVVFWLMYSKLNYRMKSSLIAAVVSGVCAPILMLIVILNFKIFFLIALVSCVLLFFYKRTSENFEIKAWKEMEVNPITASDFSDEVARNIKEETNLPYSRMQSFCAGIENIDTENDYAILYDAHPEDNEMQFREYGYLVSTRGVLFKEQTINPKNDKNKYATRTIEIPFQNVYKIKTNNNLKICYSDHKKIKLKLSDEKAEILLSVFNLAIQMGWTKVSDAMVSEHTENEDIDEQLEQAFTQANKHINENADVMSGGVLSSISKSVNYDLNTNQINDRFGGGQGHGHVGEQYGDTLDRLKFKSARREGATHIKNGADRVVNGEAIQTKYLKTAGKSIGQIFNNGQAKYTYGEGVNKKMMTIEVPRDQYNDAIKVLKKRIANGEVPNESNPDNAINYVKKGAISYEHSQIATKSIFERHTTIEMRDENNNIVRDQDGNPTKRTVTLGEKIVWSAGGDFMTGVASAAPTALVSAVWIYCNCRWHKIDNKEATKRAALSMIKPLAMGGGMYMLSSQFAGSAAGKKVAAKLFGESAQHSTEKLMGATMGTATAIFAFGPDVISCLRGRISAKQLVKNSLVKGAGLGTGAVFGTAFGPVGTVIGATIGGSIASIGSKKILDNFVQDDAVEMLRIAKEEFIETVLSVPLDKNEVESILNDTFLNKKFPKKLQSMFAADDSRQYIHDIYFDEIVVLFKQRPLPKESELLALV